MVDQSDGGCWPWVGPRHSSGAGRYLWKAKDGGNDRYVLAHRVAYFLSTGELPSYLRNLCGDLSCCKASHWWTKPTGGWKPKPRKAKRGRVRQLSTEEVQRIRLLATLSRNEDEIAGQFGLTKRQVADIALGKERPEAGGRFRTSRHRGIRHYHQEFERSLLDLRPDEAPAPTPQAAPQVAALPGDGAPSRDLPFAHRSYGHPYPKRVARSRRF